MTGIFVPAVKAKSRRLKILVLSPELLLAFFVRMRHPRTYSCDGLPEDAAVVGCVYDDSSRLVRLTIESETFREVEAGHQLETMATLMFTEYTEPVALHR